MKITELIEIINKIRDTDNQVYFLDDDTNFVEIEAYIDYEDDLIITKKI